MLAYAKNNHKALKHRFPNTNKRNTINKNPTHLTYCTYQNTIKLLSVTF